jgi:microcystin-dependent protein
MSSSIIYANTQYLSGQHIFNTIPNGTNLSLTELANAPSCNVMTLINGNIGMGTTLPLHSLHVQNSSYFVGNVGIGTSLPRRLLHVNGDIQSPILVGKIAWFAKSTAPSGWLKCNGTSINRSIYANLFAKIGTTFGVGDNLTTFGLPELRGEFIRSWDNARNIDTSRVFGSAQSAAMINHTHSGTTNTGEGTHTHTITDPGHTHTYTNHSTTAGYQPGLYNALRLTTTLNTSTAFTGISINTTNSDHTHTMTTGNPSTGGGTETRPRNIALLACIKY